MVIKNSKNIKESFYSSMNTNYIIVNIIQNFSIKRGNSVSGGVQVGGCGGIASDKVIDMHCPNSY